MTKLWSQRLKYYLKMLMKYSRYVFNDHFVIALMFFIGGLGFAYTNTLKHIKATDSIWLILVVIICLLLLSLGHLATLLKPADQLFLLPKELEMQHYLLKARRFSLILPTVFLIVGAFVLMPLLILLKNWSLVDLGALMLTLFLLKSSLLWLELESIYMNNRSVLKRKLLSGGMLVLIVSIVIMINPLIGLIGAVLAEVSGRFKTQKRLRGLLNWDVAIEKEAKRMLGIYRMINLFTDVPQISDSIKRRKYLDFLLNKIPQTHKNTYLFLFSRGLLRSKTYFGLFLRLLVLSLLLMFLVENKWLLMALAALFLYLMAFQLLPFYKQYDQNFWVAIYPVKIAEKQAAFKRIVLILMLVFVLILVLASLFIIGFNQKLFIFILILIIETTAFVSLYLPNYLKKAESV